MKGFLTYFQLLAHVPRHDGAEVHVSEGAGAGTEAGLVQPVALVQGEGTLPDRLVGLTYAAKEM